MYVYSGARCFLARVNRLKLCAPLVETSSGYAELLGQLIDAFAGPHALFSYALELPGISLSSLHCCFLSQRECPSRVCQFKGSFHEVNWSQRASDENGRGWARITEAFMPGASNAVCA